MRQMAAHSHSLGQVTSPNDCVSFTRKHEKQQMELKESTRTNQIRCSELLSDTTGEEERENGRVKWKVYRTFVTSAYRGALVPVILLCQVLFQALQMGSNYWIAWATEEEHGITKEKLIGIFVLMSVGSSVFILGRAVLLATIAIETAQQLFLSMTRCIFRAPISFFDSTPSSRILNRVCYLPICCLIYRKIYYMNTWIFF